jgi:iron(III) transport system ATP-binding protein
VGTEPSGNETVLSLDGVTKRFGAAAAVDRVSMSIRRGEVFTLLGPSGCGKTTTLRLVAGLEHPDAGEITLRDRVVASASRRLFLAPNQRNLGMVFQSYAVWPHMTVFNNVAYPLRAGGVPRKEIPDRVMRALKLVQLDEFAERPPHVAAFRDPPHEAELADHPLAELVARIRLQLGIDLAPPFEIAGGLAGAGFVRRLWT